MATARSDQKSRPRGGAQGAAQCLLICATTSFSRGPSLAARQDFARIVRQFSPSLKGRASPHSLRPNLEHFLTAQALGGRSSMSEEGQKAKYSPRADVFRSPPDSGHDQQRL